MSDNKNINIDDMIIKDKPKDYILYKALDMIIIRKIKNEGCFDLEKIPYKLKKEDINVIFNGKYNVKYDKNNLESIYQELAKDIKTLTIIQAKVIVFWYLNQKQGTSNKTIDSHLEILYKTLEYAQLLNDDFEKEGSILYYKKEFKLLKIEKLSSYIDEINKIVEVSNDNVNFFRGHSNINYQAEPSVFRENFLNKEFDMCQQLIIRSNENFSNCKNRFDYISLMQHYGLPTRLLDVTLNPLIALYFACEYTKSGIAEVIVYNVNKSNIKYKQSDTVSILSNLSKFEYEEQMLIYRNKDNFNCEVEPEVNPLIEKLTNAIIEEKPYFVNKMTADCLTQPVFLIPERDNKRMMNQKGAFVLFGLSKELYGDNDDSDNYLAYDYQKCKNKTIICIDKDSKENILKELKTYSIDKSFIYPEIHSIAEDIKNNI